MPSWIWFAPPPRARDTWGQARDPARDAIGYLRMTFALDAVPASASVRVSADGRYELWVNGARIGRGPARDYEPTYDEYDLAPVLRAGTNVIAALVRSYGRPTLWWRPSEPRGALGYGGFWLASDFGIESGDGWRARRAAIETLEAADAGVALVPPPTEGPPPLEIHDGRATPWGWAEPSFDDAGWGDAVVLGDADPPLRAREVPALIHTIVEPVAIAAAGTGAGSADQHPLAAVYADASPGSSSWRTFDFGRIVHGHPIVEPSAPSGTVVDLSCGEDLGVDGLPVRAPREWAMRAIAPGTHESVEAVGFRYLSVAARGPLDDVRVRVLERLAPRTPGASFRCSDPLLERIWDAGVRTVDLCSTDAFIDCPGREQRAWLGDSYLTSLLRMTVDPDPRLVVGNVRLHARGARPDGLLPMVAAGDFSTKRETIPDHSLLWVAGLRAIVEWTGDLALAEELAPVAARALSFFEHHRGHDDLLTGVPGWVFVDWAQLERGRTFAPLDAMYAWALDAYASLCDALGNEGSSSRARDRAARTRAAFERYWDHERGAYVDATRRVSQQTNAMAIVARCAPRDRWDAMLDYVTAEHRLVRTLTPGDPGTFGERLNRQYEDPHGFDDERDVVLAQPFFAHFLHRALDDAGREILPSIRRWQALLERGNGCFEEYWDATPGLGSRCHAWSSTPVYDLATTVLGVRAHGDDVVVAPRLGDLEWAEGAVATARGFVTVSVKRGAEPVVDGPARARVRIG